MIPSIVRNCEHVKTLLFVYSPAENNCVFYWLPIPFYCIFNYILPSELLRPLDDAQIPIDLKYMVYIVALCLVNKFYYHL